MQSTMVRHPFLRVLGLLVTIADVAVTGCILVLSIYMLFARADGLGALGVLGGLSIASFIQRAKDKERADNLEFSVLLDASKFAPQPAAEQPEPPAAEQPAAEQPAADQVHKPADETHERLADDDLGSSVRMVIANELLAEAFKLATNPFYFDTTTSERLRALTVAREQLELVESMSDRRAGMVG